MEVIIAGAGSIGLLLGSFLSEAGMNVTMYVETGRASRTDSSKRNSSN